MRVGFRCQIRLRRGIGRSDRRISGDVRQRAQGVRESCTAPARWARFNFRCRDEGHDMMAPQAIGSDTLRNCCRRDVFWDSCDWRPLVPGVCRPSNFADTSARHLAVMETSDGGDSWAGLPDMLHRLINMAGNHQLSVVAFLFRRRVCQRDGPVMHRRAGGIDGIVPALPALDRRDVQVRDLRRCTGCYRGMSGFVDDDAWLRRSATTGEDALHSTRQSIARPESRRQVGCSVLLGVCNTWRRL